VFQCLGWHSYPDPRGHGEAPLTYGIIVKTPPAGLKAGFRNEKRRRTGQHTNAQVTGAVSSRTQRPHAWLPGSIVLV
jgi:hypothetical protein